MRLNWNLVSGWVSARHQPGSFSMASREGSSRCRNDVGDV